jgi:hypothetical protein
MLEIEIVEKANAVHSRNVTIQKTGEIKQFHHQFGYASLGDAYPVKVKLSIESPAQAYPVGLYELDISSFQVGKFDALEINPFNLTINKVS